jgi:lactate dehydrogenase-like 2-hydroxyacid dehydrogenase
MTFRILICDLVGLKFDASGQPNASEVKAHIESKGGVFHVGGAAKNENDGKLHFYYLPDLSTSAEILAATDKGQYDAVIAAATFIPADAVFNSGGVRIGAGTGNMGSKSWGGGNGLGGDAPLMNTPGFNARATAQMTMKALLRFRPDLPFDALHARVAAGDFDTGKDLRNTPTAKLEGQTIAILGYGNIGREVAKLASAFGMNVQVFARAHHHTRISADGFLGYDNAQSAAQRADVISIHTGLGGFDQGIYANANLVNREVLGKLKQGATVLNFDRGECVDASALDDAMASGQVANAAIDADIFKDAAGKLSGPMVPYLPLAQKYGPRILLLPHAAADTDHPSRVAGAKQAVDQIFDALLHKRVTNLKGDLPAGYVNAGAKLGTAD